MFLWLVIHNLLYGHTTEEVGRVNKDKECSWLHWARKWNDANFLKCQMSSIYQPQTNLCFTGDCHTIVIIQPSDLCWNIREVFVLRWTASEQFPNLFFHMHAFLPDFHAFLPTGNSEKSPLIEFLSICW